MTTTTTVPVEQSEAQVGTHPVRLRRPTLRLLPAPAADTTDELSLATLRSARPASATDGPWVQGTLALSFVLPSGLPAEPMAPPQLRLVTQGEPAAVDDGVPPLKAWAARYVQALVEVLAGERPAAQLARWTERAVYDEVRARGESARAAAMAATGRRERAVLRSVHLSEPRAGAAEVSAVVRHGVRCRAVALRFETVERRWRCVEIVLG